MTEIKPCPFCGEINIGVKDNVTNKITWAYCRNLNCECTGPKVHLPKHNEMSDEEIIECAYKAWNVRKGS